MFFTYRFVATFPFHLLPVGGDFSSFFFLFSGAFSTVWVSLRRRCGRGSRSSLFPVVCLCSFVSSCFVWSRPVCFFRLLRFPLVSYRYYLYFISFSGVKCSPCFMSGCPLVAGKCAAPFVPRLLLSDLFPHNLSRIKTVASQITLCERVSVNWMGYTVGHRQTPYSAFVLVPFTLLMWLGFIILALLAIFL